MTRGPRGLTTLIELEALIIDLATRMPADTLVAFAVADYGLCALRDPDVGTVDEHDVYYGDGPSTEQVGRKVVVFA